MSNAKHTPGPWIVGPFGEIWPTSDVEFRDGKWREKCDQPRIVASASKLDEAEANAHLIAAAPDMLAALKECPLPSTMGNREDHYQRFYDWYRQHVEPVIDKAEGRTDA